jgi:pimeloyl-ACP methyl ester carboxylesterase
MAIKNITLNNKKFKISYEIQNQQQNKNKVLVFLHGWGANKELMSGAFANYNKDYKHIYIDLCGFGNSSNNYVIDTFFYAKVINAFLDEVLTNNDNFYAVIGHSFGGKIATLLTSSQAKSQNQPKLILLSSAGIIEPKKILIKAKIVLAKIFGFLKLSYFAKFLRSGDGVNLNANMYEILKLIIKENFEPIFANLNAKCDTLILWGKDDKATALDSGLKISKLIKKNKFYSFSGGHFFFLDSSNIIDVNKRIKEFLNK